MEPFFDFQGKYDEAMPLYEEAIAIFKKVLGEEHPNVAILMNNLAGLHQQQVRLWAHFRSITTPRYGAFFSVFRGNTMRLSLLGIKRLK